MNTYFNTLCIACTVLLFSNLQGEVEKQRILVSVTRITSAEQSFSDMVQIGFIVHEPSEIRGTRFYSNCASKHRSEVRAEYPLSGLFRVSISADLLNKLKDQKKEIEGDESIIDRGIDPRRLSNLIISPEVNIILIQEAIPVYTDTQQVDSGQRR